MEQVDDYTVRFGRKDDIDHEAMAEALPVRVQLVLVSPKKLKSGETTELTFEEATGKHIEDMAKAGTERAQAEVAFRVMGECCGVGPDEIKLLGGRDIARLGEVLSYFLPSGSARPV